MLGRSVQAVCMRSTSHGSCVCKAWVEFGVGEVLGSADKGDQEHDGEVGVQQGRHQQCFHWHPELPDRREQDHHNQSNQVRHDLPLFHRHCWWLKNIAREFCGQPAGHLANSDVYPASSVVLQVSRCEKRAVTFYLHCAESPSYLYYPECSQCITYTSIFLHNLCELTYTGNILENVCALLVMSIGWRNKDNIVESVGQFPS